MEKQDSKQYLVEWTSLNKNEIREIVEQYLSHRGATLSDYSAMEEHQKKIESIVEQSIF